jgi:hypothetical protein
VVHGVGAWSATCWAAEATPAIRSGIDRHENSPRAACVVHLPSQAIRCAIPLRKPIEQRPRDVAESSKCDVSSASVFKSRAAAYRQNICDIRRFQIVYCRNINTSTTWRKRDATEMSIQPTGTLPICANFNLETQRKTPQALGRSRVKHPEPNRKLLIFLFLVPAVNSPSLVDAVAGRH